MATAMELPTIRDSAPRVQTPRPDDAHRFWRVVVKHDPTPRPRHYSWSVTANGVPTRVLKKRDTPEYPFGPNVVWDKWQGMALNTIVIPIAVHTWNFAGLRGLAWILQREIFEQMPRWDRVWLSGSTPPSTTQETPLLRAFVEGNRWTPTALWGTYAPWGSTTLHTAWGTALERGDYYGEALMPVILRPNGHSAVLVCADAILEWRAHLGVRIMPCTGQSSDFQHQPQ